MRISFDVKGGLLIRQMHHWAALVFVGAIALHMARVFFTGALPPAPRDQLGRRRCCCSCSALAAGFTGYSLPDDLLSGTGLRITYSIVLPLPFVGERLVVPAVRRRVAGHRHHRPALPRAHPADPGRDRRAARRAPGVLVRQKHTQFPGPGRTERNVVGLRVWPGFAMKSVGLLFLTAGVLTGAGRAVPRQHRLAVRPVRHRRRRPRSRNPTGTSGSSRARCACSRRGRRGSVGFVINNLVYSGVVVPGVIFTALFLAPWIERRLTGDDRRAPPARPPPRRARHDRGRRRRRSRSSPSCSSAARQDVIAGMLDISVGHVTTALQIAALVGPPLAYIVTWHVCKALQPTARPDRTERAGAIVRDPPAATTIAEATPPRGRRRRADVEPCRDDGRAAMRWSSSAGSSRRRSPRRPTTSTAMLDASACSPSAVGVLVIVLVVYCVRPAPARDDRLPPQKHYNIPVEVVYTVGPAADRDRPVRDHRRERARRRRVEAGRRRDRRRARLPVAVAVHLPRPRRHRHRHRRREARARAAEQLAVRFDLTSADVIHAFWIPASASSATCSPARTTCSMSTCSTHRRLPEHRCVRRVLRARPRLHAVRRADRDARGVPGVGRRPCRQPQRKRRHDGIDDGAAGRDRDRRRARRATR